MYTKVLSFLIFVPICCKLTYLAIMRKIPKKVVYFHSKYFCTCMVGGGGEAVCAHKVLVHNAE
jgi:hypothetical protein